MNQTIPSRAERHRQKQKQSPLREPMERVEHLLQGVLPFLQSLRGSRQRGRGPGRQGPGRGQPPGNRPSLLRRILRRWYMWILPILGLGVGGLIGLVYVFDTVPVPQQTPNVEASVVLGRNGTEIGRLASQQNRQVVPLSKIDPVMQNAVLAAEDHNFYEHGAVSYRGILRAAWANITSGEITQGGSTLTQQYVKIAYLSQDRTWIRKAREAVLAIKLEQRYSKKKILEFYLNTIYFGRGAYGVEAAANTYFNVSASELNPQQAAFIAGIIRSPEYYSDPDNLDIAKRRRNTVLETMGELGMISPAEASKWQQRNLDLKKRPGIGVAASKAPYFMQKVQLQLESILGEERVSRGGLRVETTLDLKLQQEAIASVKAGLAGGQNLPRAAMVAIRPETGEIVAMYGGQDFSKRQFNYATDAARQAGSTMKPFVLATALEEGLSVNSRFDGSECITGLDEDETVEQCNFGGASYGMVTLRKATIDSINTAYLRLIDHPRVGPEKVVELANQCGFDSLLSKTGEQPAKLPAVPSLALGAGLTSTLQLTSAFGSFANDGVHMEPYAVTQVIDTSGNVLYQHRDTTETRTRCMDENTAHIVTDVLQQVIDGGTGENAQISVPAAGKTGTTNDNVDARFAGYTTDLVASVWLGYDDNRELEDVNGVERVTGGSIPADIWQEFMSRAIEIDQVDEGGEFPEADLEQGEVINPPPPEPLPQEQPGGEGGDGQGQDQGDGGDGQDQGDGEGQDQGQDDGGDGQDQFGDGGDGGGEGQGQGDGGDGQDGGDGGGGDDGGFEAAAAGEDQGQPEGENFDGQGGQ